ncbi:hypothetical protein NPIL_415421, partial [Nephila pilipes]
DYVSSVLVAVGYEQVVLSRHGRVRDVGEVKETFTAFLTKLISSDGREESLGELKRASKKRILVTKLRVRVVMDGRIKSTEEEIGEILSLLFEERGRAIELFCRNALKGGCKVLRSSRNRYETQYTRSI